MPRYQGDHRLARALLSAPYPLPLVYVQGEAKSSKPRPQVVITPIYVPPPPPPSTSTGIGDWQITPIRYADVDESTPLELRPKKAFPSSGRMVIEDIHPPVPPAVVRGKSGNETDLMSGIEDAPCIELEKARGIGRWSNETRRHPGGEGTANVLTAAFQATLTRSLLESPPFRSAAGPPPPPLFPSLVKQDPIPPTSSMPLQPLPEQALATTATAASRQSTPSPAGSGDSDIDADSEDSGNTWVAPPQSRGRQVRPVPRGPPRFTNPTPMMLHTQPSRGYLHPSRRLTTQDSGFASESSVVTVRKVPRSKQNRPMRRWEAIEEEADQQRPSSTAHRGSQRRPIAHRKVPQGADVARKPNVGHRREEPGFRNIEDLTRPKRRPSTASAVSKSSDHSGNRARKKVRQYSLTPVPEFEPLLQSFIPIMKAEPLSPPPTIPPPGSFDAPRGRTASPPLTARQAHFVRPTSHFRRHSDIPMRTSSTYSGRFPTSNLFSGPPVTPEIDLPFEQSETDRAYSPMSIDPVSGRPLLSTSWPRPLPPREIFHTPTTTPPAPPPWSYGFSDPGAGSWNSSPMYAEASGSSHSTERRSGALPISLGFGKHVHSIMLASRRKSATQRRRREVRAGLGVRHASERAEPVVLREKDVAEEAKGSDRPPKKRMRYWSSSDEDIGDGREAGRRMRSKGDASAGTVLLPPAETQR